VIRDFVPDDRYKEIIDDIANNFTQEAEKISIKSSNDGIQTPWEKILLSSM
jgi:hypothetical protein